MGIKKERCEYHSSSLALSLSLSLSVLYERDIEEIMLRGE
jgi:hypothetical protein